MYFPTDSEQLAKIKLIKSTENLGPYRGLNRLLDEAHGDYIAIQDHDDIWKAEKLEKQIDFLETHPEYIGCGTKTVMYYEGDKKYFEYFLEKTNFFTVHPSLLFRYDGKFRYDTSTTEYMCDAYSLKYNLCR
jgi:glycosyltransferase involved in cell wall biosynthesis